MLWTDLLVIGVEEDTKLRVERAIPAPVLLEDEGLEEPAGVREMPLGRTGVVHGLRLAVLRRQRRAQALGRGAHLAVAGGQVPGRRRRARYDPCPCSRRHARVLLRRRQTLGRTGMAHKPTQ